MNERNPARSFGAWLSVVVLALLLLGAPTVWSREGAGAVQPESEGLVKETFKPNHLDLEEVAGMLREMTAVEDVVADPESHTIVVHAAPAEIRMMDSYIKIFDTEASQGSEPLEIRVFHLQHLGAREAVTLLRINMQVTEVAMNPARRCVAVRDTPDRLEKAAAILEEHDVEMS